MQRAVHERIAAGRLRYRSKPSLLIEQLGLDGLALLMVAALAVAVNFVLFWLRINDAFSWLLVGPLGIRTFFEAFPYLWLVSALVALLAVGTLFARLNLRARPMPPWLAVSLVLVGISAGGAAAFSNVNERLLAPSAPLTVQRLQRIYQFTSHQGSTGLVGSVRAITPTGIELDVRGARVRVILTEVQRASLSSLDPGDRLLITSRQAGQQPVQPASIRKLRTIQRPLIQLNVHSIERALIHSV